MIGDLSGQWLGQYRLDAVIGRGSTATVYRAYQQSLGRYVAVKVLHHFLDPQASSRFRREAQAIAQLSHPNILPIYDYGEEGGRRYFVTQLIPGGTNLAHVAGNTPMDAAAALHLAGYILAALGYAHARGVVHRDVKPANILLPAPAWPLLADFGIARLADETTQLTPPGTVLGTAAYIAPERALDRPADARSDLYSLGVVLYELIAGRLPFDGATPAAVLRAHAYSRPTPLRAHNRALAPALEAAVMRALEKDPDRRYQTAAEMAAALAAVAGTRAAAPQPTAAPDPYRTVQLPTLDEDETQPVPAPGPRRRGGWAPLALAALLLLGLTLGALILRGRDEAARAPQAAPTPPPSAIASADGGPPPPAGTAAPPVATELPQPAEPPPPAAPEPPPPTETPPALAATEPPPATAAPAPAEPPVAAPAPVAAAAGQVVLDDQAWTGGYGGAGSPRTYGGRSAVWAYGEGTGYDTLRARFSLAGQPTGAATLILEGMDAEGRAKAQIAVRVNGALIYEGPNPLPDDDLPLESGTWAAAGWQFDAALLRAGENEVSVSNLSPGQFSLPPFVMIDYAVLTLEG